MDITDKELDDYMIDSYILLSKYGTPSLRAYYKKLVKKLKNEQMNKIYIYYFMSYSGDEFFMKSKEKKYNKFQVEQFCKEKIPWEYEAWGEEKFKYNKFNIYECNENSFVKINRSFGEYYKVIPNDIKEYDIAYFTDQYRPDTYDINNEKL